MITEPQWEMIVERIPKGQCIPFLGAGVNRGGTDAENLPLGSELALKILQKMTGKTSANLSDLENAIKFHSLEEYHQRTGEAEVKLRKMMVEAAGSGEFDEEEFEKVLKDILFLNTGDLWPAHLFHASKLGDYKELRRVALQDLARVSLRYRSQLDAPGFMSKLQELIPDVQRKPSKLLMLLASLPFRLLVTTNFDRLMERAMELLHVRDILKPARLLARLGSDGGDPLTTFLREQFPDALMDGLAALDPEAAAPDALLEQTVAELNRLLQDKSLYHLGDVAVDDDGRATLVGFKLPAEVQVKVEKRPETYLQVRRSRLLLEAVYSEELRPHRPSEVIVQPIRGFQGEEVGRTTNRLAELDMRKGVTLFKLHGSFPHETSDPNRRPVITEEDYIEFLTYMGGDGINHLITSKIKDSTLLFLGYGLEDWNFRVLFKGLVEDMLPSEQRMSFAIQKNPSEFWVKYWGKKGVTICDMDVSEFAEQLDHYCRLHGVEESQEPAGGEPEQRPMGRGPVKGARR